MSIVGPWFLCTPMAFRLLIDRDAVFIPVIVVGKSNKPMKLREDMSL